MFKDITLVSKAKQELHNRCTNFQKTLQKLTNFPSTDHCLINNTLFALAPN